MTEETKTLALELVDDAAVKEPSSRALVAPPAAGPMAGALAFLQNGGSPEQLEKMMVLQERWEANEARKEFVDAMAEFKKNPPVILKDKVVRFATLDGGATEYSHARLGTVTQAIVHGLAQHGISHRWDIQQENARVYVTCVLTHRRGHSETTTLDGSPDTSGKKNAIQQTASTISYLQRYTLLAATGLATQDMPMDDDGAGGAPAEDPADLTEGIDPTLLQAARDASLRGRVFFRDFVKKLTVPERASLEPISARLKDAALVADEAGK